MYLLFLPKMNSIEILTKLPDLAPAGFGSSHSWSPALPFPELLHKLCFLGYLHPTFSGHTPVRSWTSPWSDRFSPRNGLPKVYFPNNQKRKQLNFLKTLKNVWLEFVHILQHIATFFPSHQQPLLYKHQPGGSRVPLISSHCARPLWVTVLFVILALIVLPNAYKRLFGTIPVYTDAISCRDHQLTAEGDIFASGDL